MNRIATLDTLRGLSLFGILVVNVPFFLMPDGSAGTYTAEHFAEWWDQAATFIMHAIFEGKFIMIFSFLFGWGLHTQMSRDQGFKAQYYRRLFGLFVIGLMHAVFLFVGDILVSYAILGIPLLWVRDWSVQRLVKGAFVFWIISIACHAVLGLLIQLEPVPSSTRYEDLVELHQNGSFSAIMANRIEELIVLYVITPLLFMPSVFGMFMLGLAAAKAFAETGIEAAKPLAQKVMRVGLLPAVALNLLYGAISVWPIEDQVLTLVLRAVAVVSLSLIYLAAATLYLTHPAADKWGALLGGEGRMSLSMYIAESALMGFIAYSYGFALYGKVGPAGQLLIAVALYLVLLISSHLWTKAFKIGPMEWILRSITQLRIVDIK
jgi:uncharacterized protein